MAEEDSAATISNIYSLVQQLNQQSATLVQQVSTLTERAQEDRNQMANLAADIQKLKIKVYSAGAAVVLLGTLLALMDKVSSMSGGG